MRRPLTFFVAGIPKPAGSKRGFFIPKLKRVVITDANPNSKDWKTDVKHAAQEAYQGELWDGPISVVFKFFQTRPACHFGTGKNAGVLKESAPAWPSKKPDLLKLARGVEDALTSVIWVDDAQIVHEELSKSYETRPGVEITIWEAVS